MILLRERRHRHRQAERRRRMAWTESGRRRWPPKPPRDPEVPDITSAPWDGLAGAVTLG